MCACSNLPMRSAEAPVNDPFSCPNSSLSSRSSVKGGAVHVDEWPGAPRRAIVNGARDQFLADAAFAADEDRHVAVGDPLDHHQTLRIARPHVVRLRPDRRAVDHGPVPVDGLLERGVERDFTETLGVGGLDHVVHRAEADGFHDSRRVLAARQPDEFTVARRKLQRRRHRPLAFAVHQGQKRLSTEGLHMAKYGRKASKKVERAMHERKRGTLRSGGSGKKVTSRKQAIAIGLSEARRAGAKVPRKRRRS